MADILSVGSKPNHDNNIIKKQIHTYSPYTSSYEHNDEIRIAIQSQDLYILPSDSYISLDVSVTRAEGAEHATAVGSWVTGVGAHLFSEIRYEINNVEVDRIKYPGFTSYLKMITCHPDSRYRETVQGSFYSDTTLEARTYQLIIPLYFLFGFCDDYRKIIMNAKHELILVRSRHDKHAYMCPTDSFKFKITRIQWKVPHITLSDNAKLTMLRYLERKRSIVVPYRAWDLYELPQLPQSTKNIWTVKSTTQISKPRYVFVVLQTNPDAVSTHRGLFNHCDITDIKLLLNGECYPYESYNSDFTNKNFNDVYKAFAQIQGSYYPTTSRGVYAYDYKGYLTSGPIFTFDCSRSDDSLTGGTVDVRLEINAKQNIPANTAAYCLIIYESQFEYSPFSGVVVRSS